MMGCHSRRNADANTNKNTNTVSLIVLVHIWDFIQLSHNLGYNVVGGGDDLSERGQYNISNVFAPDDQ